MCCRLLLVGYGVAVGLLRVCFVGWCCGVRVLLECVCVLFVVCGVVGYGGVLHVVVSADWLRGVGADCAWCCWLLWFVVCSVCCCFIVCCGCLCCSVVLSCICYVVGLCIVVCWSLGFVVVFGVCWWVGCGCGCVCVGCVLFVGRCGVVCRVVLRCGCWCVLLFVRWFWQLWFLVI